MHAGILSMALEYDNSNENQEDGNTRIILPVYIEVNDKVLLAEDAKMKKISGEGNTTDTYFGYARLLYEYAIRDRYSFAEKLIRESRRKEKSGISELRYFVHTGIGNKIKYTFTSGALLF